MRIKNSIAILLVLAFGIFLYQVLGFYHTQSQLNATAEYYNTNAPAETGVANVVTAIVVTYRGLDTLGEVTVLFLTAIIVGYILRHGGNEQARKLSTSEILITSTRVLIPGSIVLGIYVFINGHLTLARLKRRVELKPFLGRHKDEEFGEFMVGKFVLFESRLRPGGPEHRRLGQ